MEKVIAFRRVKGDLFVNDRTAAVGMKCHRFFTRRQQMVVMGGETEPVLVVDNAAYEQYDLEIVFKDDDQVVVKLDNGEIQVWRPSTEQEYDGIPLWRNEHGEHFALADASNDEE